MGLDMYLFARKFVWHDDSELADAIRKVAPCPVSDKPRYIEYEAMYWRKANQIHQWFVNNIQDGNDDCGNYYVSTEQLNSLRDLCKLVLDKAKLVDGTIHAGDIAENGRGFKPILEPGKVIENPNEIDAILPTAEGFFFGSTDYDEYYLRDIEETKEALDKILASDTKDWSFEYHSSW